ncbi:hypothetical protein E1B28_008600 [Marasmius oreades]|uniref:MARVEL domain-containing protein n=1 Tax=Marasmius oreades TaxID=181124 RepID=A0A9P7RYU5_9AGAR|nr:uncharacterized protein E1B28_008600 [Marasmius oreades]KAG7092234.1 hypothetical protein E1B28_008600 [Marasmius oreades]
MFVLLHIVHVTLIGLLCASLAADTGTLFEAITMAMDWVALISLALCLAYSMWNLNVLLGQEYGKAWMGELRAFLCCGFFSLGNATAFSVRMHTRRLCVDFSGITGESCKLASIVLALSWVTVLFSITGALARYLDRDGFEQAQATSPEHSHVQTVEVQPGQSPTSQGLRPVPSTPLSHKSSYRVPLPPPSPTWTTEYGRTTPKATASADSTEYWTIIPV